MSALALDVIAPLESPLPAPPEGEILTDSQWKTLMAIADTVLPSLVGSSQASQETLSIDSAEYEKTVDSLEAQIPKTGKADLVRAYLEECPSKLPGFKQSLHRVIGEYLREDARKGLRVLLSVLE